MEMLLWDMKFWLFKTGFCLEVAYKIGFTVVSSDSTETSYNATD